MHQGGKQQTFDETVVVFKALQLFGHFVNRLRPFAVHLQIDFVLLLQHGQELRLVELLGVLEVYPHHVGERFVAVSHNIPEVAQRNDIAQTQSVAPVDEKLKHDLEGGAFPLQRTRHGHQCLDESRAERVNELEHGPVGFPRQQDFHDLRADLGRLLEGILQLGPTRIVLRSQHPLMGDQREVAVLQRDRVEPAFPVGQHVGEV